LNIESSEEEEMKEPIIERNLKRKQPGDGVDNKATKKSRPSKE
jgi:hypothetical protein